MHCVIINLARAKKRREHIISEFQSRKLEFEIFVAKDWKDLTQQDWQLLDEEPKKFYGMDRDWFAGALACWISHRQVWKSVLETNHEMVAIFEDDAILADNIKLALAKLEDWQQIGESKYDIVFLINRHPNRRFFPIFAIGENFNLGLIRFNTMGAVGYVITRPAMHTLLNKFPTCHCGIDSLMHCYTFKHKLKTFNLEPTVVSHKEDGQKSYTNENRVGINRPRIDRRLKLKRICNFSIPKVIYFYRRIWFRSSIL